MRVHIELTPEAIQLLLLLAELLLAIALIVLRLLA